MSTVVEEEEPKTYDFHYIRDVEQMIPIGMQCDCGWKSDETTDLASMGMEAVMHNWLTGHGKV